MKCLFQSLGKTSHETTYLITYKYIREYWLTKNTFFFGYYLSCRVLTIQKVTELFFGKILQKGHQNNYWKKVVLNFFSS